MNKELIALSQEQRRLRLLYSIHDLELALSAIVFLGECDPDERYDRAAIRRFRCYETAAIVAYARRVLSIGGGHAVPKPQDGWREIMQRKVGASWRTGAPAQQGLRPLRC